MTNARIQVPILSARKAVTVVTGDTKYSPKALAEARPDTPERIIPFLVSNAAIVLLYKTRFNQLPKIAPPS
jgi:hypothetical protein